MPTLFAPEWIVNIRRPSRRKGPEHEVTDMRICRGLPTLPPRTPFRALGLVVLVGLGACGTGDEGGTPATGDTLSVPPSATVLGEPAVFTSDDGMLTFTRPERWGDEVNIRETTPAELEWSPPAPERVFQFILTPRDPRFAGENILNLYVYDPEVWEGVGAAASEIGEEITRLRSMVYVAGQPRANPFPEGSVDHGRFERFRMDREEIREALGGG